MFISTQKTYKEILSLRQHLFEDALSTNQISPFIYPFETMSALFLFLAILSGHRLRGRFKMPVLWATVAVIFVMCISTMQRCRSLGFASGYGIGLMCSWGQIMTVTLLLCNNAATDFQRLEKRSSDMAQRVEDRHDGVVAIGTDSETPTLLKPRNRKVYAINGHVHMPAEESSSKCSAQFYSLHWQSLPPSLLDRVEWAADLITTFRGVGWNWRISTVGPLDSDIPPTPAFHQSSKESSWKADPMTAIVISSSTVGTLQRAALADFALYYLLLDLIKTVMISDPYFLGIAPLSSPTPWALLSKHSFMTKLVRLLLSLTGVYSELSLIFSLSPLYFTLLVPLPGLDKFSKSPLLHPNLYPPYWGPPTTLLTRGLAGFWGQVWHQMFRFGISEPSRALIAKFKLNPRSQLARVLQVGIAFLLTGFIHACGSYTTFPVIPGSNHPISGAFAFFAFQGVGVIMQGIWVGFMRQRRTSMPGWISKSANAAFVAVWLWFTAPLLVDDFAGCGIWLFEPVPFSLVEMARVALGAAGIATAQSTSGRGVWCWGGRWIGINSGTGRSGWWESGLVVY